MKVRYTLDDMEYETGTVMRAWDSGWLEVHPDSWPDHWSHGVYVRPGQWQYA